MVANVHVDNCQAAFYAIFHRYSVNDLRCTFNRKALEEFQLDIPDDHSRQQNSIIRVFLDREAAAGDIEQGQRGFLAGKGMRENDIGKRR
ncbi:hypothetical protein BMS3Abin13_00615 [bacterium BMS3Abin13]|nr:hypothetical protein BMS3Abin13_00615 [bacterium BMS3Abin13]